ncbi:hypothetical protein AC579_768 [Pseudocercospora musae]|uniref:Uncharacterized protein n=1 Tax=Pseudocercospora musae TaxID=113226 RepID=A0A139IJB8_9PEZI|nr:hypothetical protein AC579_768 [Pseudocercospora musae]
MLVQGEFGAARGGHGMAFQRGHELGRNEGRGGVMLVQWAVVGLGRLQYDTFNLDCIGVRMVHWSTRRARANEHMPGWHIWFRGRDSTARPSLPDMDNAFIKDGC